MNMATHATHRGHSPGLELACCVHAWWGDCGCWWWPRHRRPRQHAHKRMVLWTVAQAAIPAAPRLCAGPRLPGGPNRLWPSGANDESCGGGRDQVRRCRRCTTAAPKCGQPGRRGVGSRRPWWKTTPPWTSQLSHTTGAHNAPTHTCWLMRGRLRPCGREQTGRGGGGCAPAGRHAWSGECGTRCVRRDEHAHATCPPVLTMGAPRVRGEVARARRTLAHTGNAGAAGVRCGPNAVHAVRAAAGERGAQDASGE